MADRDINFVIRVRDAGSAVVAAFRKEVQSIGGAVSQVRSAFAPLTGTLASLTAGIAGLAGARKALSEARDETNAVRRLQAALGDSVRHFERISSLAQDVQRRTTISAGQVTSTAADLLNRGVSVSQLSTAIESVVQTSSALNSQLSSTGEQIAAMYGGTVPRELAKAVPALQRLSVEQLKSGEGARLLLARYKGQAEALAATDFGRVQQEQAKINDAFVRIGNVLVRLQATVLPRVTAQFEKLAAVLEAPPGQRFLKVLENMAVLLVDNADKVAILGLSLKALDTGEKVLSSLVALSTLAGLKIGGITAAVAGLKAVFAVVATALVGVAVVGFREILFYLGLTQTGGDDLIDTARTLAARWKDGSITIRDALRLISIDFAEWHAKSDLRFYTIGSTIRKYLHDVPVEVVSQMMAKTLLLFDALAAKVKAKFTLIQSYNPASDVTQGDVDVANAEADQRAKLAQDFDFDFGRALEAADRQHQDRVAAEAARVDDAVAKAQAERDKFLKEKNDRANSDLPTRKPPTEVPEYTMDPAQLARLQTDRERLFREADARIHQIEALDAESIKRRNDLEIAHVESQFRLREISLSTYLEKRERAEMQSLDAEIAATRNRFDVLNAERAESRKTFGESDIAEQNRLREEAAVLEARLVELEQAKIVKAAELKVKRQEAVAAVADELKGNATTAQSQYNNELQRTESLLESGQVTAAQARQTNTRAADAYRSELGKIRQNLANVAALETDPARRVAYERLNSELAEMAENIDLVGSRQHQLRQLLTPPTQFEARRDELRTLTGAGIEEDDVAGRMATNAGAAFLQVRDAAERPLAGFFEDLILKGEATWKRLAQGFAEAMAQTAAQDLATLALRGVTSMIGAVLFGEQAMTAAVAGGAAARTGIRGGETAAQGAQVGVQVASHTAGETAKTGSTFMGSLARGAARIGETAMAIVQVGVRVAGHVAGEIAMTAATIAQTGIRIVKYAAEALAAIAKGAAQAISALASVPIVGPALALGAMAAIVAAGVSMVSSLTGGGGGGGRGGGSPSRGASTAPDSGPRGGRGGNRQSFAKGGWVRSEGNPGGVVTIDAHSNEFVTRAKQAQKYAPLLEALNSDTISPEAAAMVARITEVRVPRLPELQSMHAARSVQRAAAGGTIRPMATEESDLASRPQVAVVAPTEQNARALLSNSPLAFAEMLMYHKNLIADISRARQGGGR